MFMTNSNDNSGELLGQKRRRRWSPEQKLAMVRKSGQATTAPPFREGNGRAQRSLFVHLIMNVGFEISWWG
ncbi:hypothetical protein SAMN03159443_00337 [Pseudomonas sp. NFACC15-1]|nr:hypothetical protein SAMN03159443_00337 [Pseudomonas sp. NFACC15-1]SDB53806.1 hypothetical protein SAMN03159290_04116 [Pseudomonas sp. NFACC13-1]SDW34167.1 hypothetical protein SAMN03159380_00506 [Pseudomonas sp. NFACC14]